MRNWGINDVVLSKAALSELWCPPTEHERRLYLARFYAIQRAARKRTEDGEPGENDDAIVAATTPLEPPSAAPRLIFNKLVPQPLHLEFGKSFDPEYKQWQNVQEWNHNHWGTKWGPSETELTALPDGRWHLRFQTAWEFPVQVFFALGRLHPHEDIVVKFADEDYGTNCGIARFYNFEGHTDDDAEVVKNLSGAIAGHVPAGMSLEVTGGPAFGADVAGAFKGANFMLLAITIGIVAILLILTYRSPILWLLPLIAVGLADGLAGRITAAGNLWNLQFDSGIISVLVFGAGTNYALLLINHGDQRLRTQHGREPQPDLPVAQCRS